MKQPPDPSTALQYVVVNRGGQLASHAFLIHCRQVCKWRAEQMVAEIDFPKDEQAVRHIQEDKDVWAQVGKKNGAS